MNHETQNLAELGVVCAIVNEYEQLNSKIPSRIPNRRNKSREVE